MVIHTYIYIHIFYFGHKVHNIMFMQTVIEVVYQFPLPKFTEDCCRAERQIQWDFTGSAFTGLIAQQCMHANCLQIWFRRDNGRPHKSLNLNPLHYHVWGAVHEALWNVSSEAKYSLWIKSRIWQISAEKKLFWVLEWGWKSTWGLVEALLSICYYSKCVHTLNAISVRHFFHNVKTSKKLPWLKAAKFCHFWT